ncbi:ribosomal biogenesis protein LAS1L [Brachionichthys hirsutus]|uniref:ribosomal biogenesis protein LAS1L n=1 Tax=Brachionichthys hirsutus TaxID=412623 RepID=UPI003604E233
MKKSSEKRRHVVAWANKAEWDQVLEYLYSTEPAQQRFALDRVSAWKGRCADSIPLAVECTADLVRCQVQDRCGPLNGEGLVLLYGGALIRFVNLITERQQGKSARPLRALASNLNIPEWVVNLRHDFTHRKKPTLYWCRKGCQVALEWLLQQYWARQLGGGPHQDWGSQLGGEGDEMEQEEREDELVARQREAEAYKNARDLLIAFEKEQYRALDRQPEGKEAGPWPAPLSDMSWLLGEIKRFSLESSDLLIGALLEDGFLVPTVEQLATLGCGCWGGAAPSEPTLPPAFLHFWLPLLRTLNLPAFIHLLLEKLFGELKLLSGEQNHHRAFYISAWISQVLVCNGIKVEPCMETKAQKKARERDRIFVNRIHLRWQRLLAACLAAPCSGTPHLLRLILSDMEHPLPPETQEKLLRLCRIYTQTAPGVAHAAPGRGQQPVYTLESFLQRHPGSFPADAERSESSQDGLAWAQAENAKLLEGSPWQVCADEVQWRDHPLGKAPGQSDDPSYLMAENYSTMAVSEQPVELEGGASRSPPGAVGPARTAEGRLWSQTDVNKLKSGLRLF